MLEFAPFLTGKPLLASAFCLVLLLIMPQMGWAEPEVTLVANPDAVTEQDDLDMSFVLTLTNDQFQPSVSTADVELGGDFQNLSVIEAVYQDTDEVTVQLTGDLTSNTGQGTITMKASSLSGDADVTASVTVNLAEFAGGTGTEGDPYLIANAYHLNNVHNHLNAYYQLINDIDLHGGEHESDHRTAENGYHHWTKQKYALPCLCCSGRRRR